MSNFDHFKEQLASSYQTVYSVAHWLTGKGYAVTLPPHSMAERPEDWEQHADSGDLHLHLRLEVKRRQIAFTGQEDFPFPDIMVSAKDAYDRADPKPFTYYMVNKAGTHMAVVRESTKPHWVVKRVKDGRRRDYSQEVYHCPIKHVSFFTLPSALPTPSNTLPTA